MGKVYKTVVRKVMLLYGAETWAAKKAQKKNRDIAEMEM